MADENTGNSAPAESTGDDSSSTLLDSGSTIETNDASVSDLQDLANDPNLSTAEKKEVKKMLKQLEIKYNGKTEKVDLPFEIEEQHAEYMRKQLQMSKMGQSKAQEAAEWERDTMSFLQELKTNPRKVLSNPHLGVDLKKIAAEILEEELSNAQKTPEELEKEEYIRKLKAYEEKEAAADKKMKEMERAQVIEKAYAQYDASMSKAMETYDIPKTPIALYEMAHLMSLEIKRGYEPDMDAIAQMVQEKFSGNKESEIERIKKMTPAQLRELLGEEVFEQDRKERIAKVKKTPVPVKTAVQDIARSEKKEETPVIKKTFKEQWGI